MSRRNPALVVCLGTGRNRGTVSTHNRNLIAGVDLLAALGGAFCTIATFAAARFLREERRDPGVVDEVDGGAEERCEEDVEKDAIVVSNKY